MAQTKPTIYLDTNILSILCYRGSNVSTIHQQMVTQEWWDTERRWFRLYGSVFTAGELSQGSYRGKEQALRLVRRLPYLPFTSLVEDCAAVYLEEHIIPKERPGDAFQLSFATVHQVDYLLTWNYAHLANVDTQRKLEALNKRNRLRTPLLVSPETMPRVGLGQSIRRSKHED